MDYNVETKGNFVHKYKNNVSDFYMWCKKIILFRYISKQFIIYLYINDMYWGRLKRLVDVVRALHHNPNKYNKNKSTYYQISIYFYLFVN